MEVERNKDDNPKETREEADFQAHPYVAQEHVSVEAGELEDTLAGNGHDGADPAEESCWEVRGTAVRETVVAWVVDCFEVPDFFEEAEEEEEDGKVDEDGGGSVVEVEGADATIT